MTIYIFRARSAPSARACYEFRGSGGRTKWPTDGGAFLGAAGCWNFALRIGGRPIEIAGDALSSLPADGLLLAAVDAPLAEMDRNALRAHAQRGRWIVASGDSAAWIAVFPEIFTGGPRTCENPYAAVGYRHGEHVDLMAPPRWPVHVFSSLDEGTTAAGEVVFVSGERQTPARAAIAAQLHAPAVVRRENLVYLNASPFHALQAWLQGQEDLQPWLAWRHRLFWLDDWVSSVRAILERSGVQLPDGSAAVFPGLGETCVVLRHDLDYSRDTSYLDAEVKARVPGVHAVLRDGNAAFWRDTLSSHPDHETAFHYNTARYSRLETVVRRAVGLSPRPYVPKRSAIVRSGLANQVRWARRRGLGVATLHRHLSFLIYPEWVDAFDQIQRAKLGVLGGSSMFRAQVLRWGVDRADGARGSYADHPDAMFPYWMPFKLAHSADGGRLIDGWESASVMEIEPALLERMLEHKTPGLRHRIITLNFHPAHARRPTFGADGTLPDFIRILEIIQARQIPVLTLRDVFARLNRLIAGNDGAGLEPRGSQP